MAKFTLHNAASNWRRALRFDAARTEERVKIRAIRSELAFLVELDARSNLCYTENNVEQDHNFDGNGRCACYGSDGLYRAVMHPLQCACSTSVQAGFLR